MKRFKDTISKTPYPKLPSYAWYLYGPIIKGSMLSSITGLLSLFIIPYVAVRSLIGPESFQPYWDPTQITEANANQILYGRKGLLFVSLGSRLL